ncbi:MULTISPECIES: DUF1631 family protein [unclassified Polaromonas]|uniref:DUF1631 family protein n=1 Tax=unclassified Polaromonas TaxID=2638319 RepID=UPI000F08423E|nr:MULTISPECIES: DUF1631 family protein [unclassified Polaromonas]AYQ28014.1 DUF1631 family protein [Polaromonas sp. SP1]QGJ17127.1 DUF1631 family protein [Polaromonas sp. Pch-P]
MASQPDVLQSCLQAAAKAARAALEQCIEDAVAGLQVAETQSTKVSERDEMATAWRELQKHKPAWATQYPADLLAHFKANAAVAAQAARTPEASPEQIAASAAASSSAFASLTHASFSLVDDSHVSQAIESSRLLQLVLPAVEQSLAELNKLISSVQGLPNVRPDLNPLRPDVFAQTLREMVAASNAEPPVAALWFRFLAPPLGRELKRLYERIINQLELANVQGASYRVLQTPASAGRRRGQGGNGSSAAAMGTGSGNGGGGGTGFDGPGGEGGFGEGNAAPAPQYADLSNYEIRDELFQDFLFHGGGNAHHGLAPSYYQTVEKELTALREAPDSGSAPLAESRPGYLSDYEGMPAVDRPQRLVNERSHLDAEVWGSYAQPRERAIIRTQLKKEAQQVGQVLGLEVVRKLVNQVAQDPRLLVPVREAIVALEPSLLRLAMVDPRFFSDEGHAGRRVMERVAQRSFKYNDEFSPEFLAFFEPVTRAFNELNGLTIEDAQPFGMVLASLEYGWDEQDQQESQNRSNVLQALRFAEERQTQADQIAFELSTRSDLEQVPGLVLDFLFGPWALAMAHAKLADTRNQIDPMGFGSVVPDLLWSVKREVTLKRPAKLIEMIPGLLSKLHEGLELLGQDPRESEPFFEGLMKLHRPVLKLRRLKSRRDAEESGAMPLEPDDLSSTPEALPATPEQRRAKAAAHPWLAREELDAAGFEDTLPTAPGDLAPLEEEHEKPAAQKAAEAKEATDSGGQELDSSHAELLAEQQATASAPPAMAQSDAERLLLNLRSGHWVDLYSRRRWLRAQLIWASTRGTLFMFVSHGGQPHSMTKRSCERLIRERLLRPVDSHGVVAQALDVVASEAAAQTAPAQHAEPETA